MIQNGRTEKPRGYAFIEYEHERDMHGKNLRVSDTLLCIKKQFFVQLKREKDLIVFYGKIWDRFFGGS